MKHKQKEKPKEEKPFELNKADMKELRQQLENLQKEKDELFGKLQRVSADYTNFQKRAPRQIADTIAYEKERIIKTLLPAMDNFEHTLQNAYSAESADVLVKAIEIIYEQMLEILKSHNVEQIKALGEKFDPALHEAMMQQSDPGKEEDLVLEEFQKGYKLNDRVIRPSKVIVNKLPSEQPTQGEKEQKEEKVDAEEQTTDESKKSGME